MDVARQLKKSNSKNKKPVSKQRVKLVKNEFESICEAIHRVQAVIEFDTEGNVITANDNFLQTLGYGLSEIEGKHHSMFCDANYTSSPDYKNFG